jgi:hypothetical protein
VVADQGIELEISSAVIGTQSKILFPVFRTAASCTPIDAGDADAGEI